MRAGLTRAKLRIIAAIGLALSPFIAVQASYADDEEDLSRVLVFGTEGAYPPFNYIDASGRLKGFDIDLGRALCADMKISCSFVARDWDSLIPALNNQDFDVILASMSITEDRKKHVLFTDKYYGSSSHFIAHEIHPFTDVSPDAVLGMRIGVQRDTVHEAYLRARYAGYASIKAFDTQDAANQALSTGSIDLVLADTLVLYGWLSGPEGGCCVFVGKPRYDQRYFGVGIGMALRHGKEDLRDRINASLKRLIANGTYDAINYKYFPFSIY